MLILNIKEKGRYIELPGYKPFRTPAQVNISNLNLTNVLMYLKANNITRYEIISTTEENGEPNNKSLKKKENIDLSKITELITQDKEQMTNRLSRIEKLLQGILNKKPEIITLKEVEKNETKKDFEDDDVVSFIPSINIDGFNSKTSTDTTISSRRDIGENVELLKKLNKKEE